jgi:acyl-CoA dehydrogenase
MDFDYSPKTKDMQARLLKFMDEHIYPNENATRRAGRQHRQGQTLDRAADHRGPQAQGPRRRPVEPVPAGRQRAHRATGAGLTNQEYAPLARSWAACPGRSEVFNCSAPDTGNMETIARYGSETPTRRAGSNPCWKARSARPSP